MEPNANSIGVMAAGREIAGERIIGRYTSKYEGWFAGVSENVVFGPGKTSDHHVRHRFSVAKINGNGTCDPARWLHSAVATSPQVVVHVGVPAFGWVEFEVIITEVPG